MKLHRLAKWGAVALLAAGCGGGGGGTVPPDTADAGGLPGAAGAAGNAVNAPGCTVAGNEVRITAAAGDSLMPSVHADAGQFLLLWSDARTGSADIFSLRLNAAGAPAGAEAPVASTPQSSTRPTATDLGGGNWFAAWEEIEAGDALSVSARKLQDPGAPTQVMSDGFMQARPRLVQVAGEPLVAWMTMSRTDPGAATITVARFTAVGSPAGAPLAIGTGQPAHYPAVAVGTGATAAVAYVAGTGQVRLALIDAGPNLTITRDVVVRDLPAGASNPALAWDGQGWLVAWEDLRGGTEEAIYAARVGGDGAVAAAQLVSGPGDGSANWPQIATGTGGISMVTYYGFPSDAEIMARAIGSDGLPRGAAPLKVSNSASGKARFPSATFQPATGEFGVAWHDTRDGNAEIYFARVACR